jgi:drug/metabolite transporter (DMT)-like permease
MAATLALVAAFLFALAAALQQKGALNLPTISLADPMSLVRLVGEKTWLIGTLALFTGYLFQAGALDRGRLSIIQPLLVTTVVFALPLGYFLTKQHVGRREVGGAAVIIIGLGLFVYFGDPAGGNDNASNTQWAIAIGLLSVLSVLILVFGSGGGLSMKAAVYGTVAGVLFGVSSSLTKPTLTYLHQARARCSPTGSATPSRSPACSGSFCSRCRSEQDASHRRSRRSRSRTRWSGS